MGHRVGGATLREAEEEEPDEDDQAPLPDKDQATYNNASMGSMASAAGLM